MFGFLPRIRSGSVFLAMSLTVRSMTAVGESAMSTAVYPLAMRCSVVTNHTNKCTVDLCVSNSEINRCLNNAYFKQESSVYL